MPRASSSLNQRKNLRLVDSRAVDGRVVVNHYRLAA